MRHFWWLPLLCILLSCGKEQGDLLTLKSETEEAPEPAPAAQTLVIASQDANHRGLGFYTVDGEFIRNTDFRKEAGTPRGIAPYDFDSFLVSVDTTDAIYHVTLSGEKTLFHGSAQFNGAQYGIVRAPAGHVYAVESNRIEAFSAEGLRMAEFYITGTIGACSLTSPRGLIIRSDGRLVAADPNGGGKILVYDISDPANPVCESSVPFANSPVGIIEHSDGKLYISTTQNHQVYSTDLDGSNRTVVWSTDTAIIQTPTAILEHPNGNILVASGARDTIEEITTAGARVGTEPFIEDIVSLNVSAMAFVGDVASEVPSAP